MPYAVVYMGRVIASGSEFEMRTLYEEKLKEVANPRFLLLIW